MTSQHGTASHDAALAPPIAWPAGAGSPTVIPARALSPGQPQQPQQTAPADAMRNTHSHSPSQGSPLFRPDSSESGTSITHGDKYAEKEGHAHEGEDEDGAGEGEPTPGEKGGVVGASPPAGAGGPPPGAPGRPRKYSHNFFDPELKPLRAVILKVLGGAFVILTCVMWITLPVYWGSLWKSASYTNKLRILVVDYDSSTAPAGSTSLGSAIIAATEANAQGIVDNVGYEGHRTPKGTLGWDVVDPSDYADVQSVADAVYNEKAWGAVVINSGATADLLAARQRGDASYSPRSAMTFIYEQGRNEQAAGNYIVPISQSVLMTAQSEWNAESAATYIAANSGNATAMLALASAPQTISPGTSYALDNIRPFSASVATAIELVGLIYLLIFAFVMTMNMNAVRDIIGPFLKTSSLLKIRIFIPLFLYFWISLIFSMINLPFKVPFGAHWSYGQGWAIWWMLLWVGMAALGFATEFFITILGPKFVAFSLILLIIFNVSVAALPHELQPWFYRYQPASVFYQLNRSVRTIIFDTRNVIPEAVGILFAWVIGSICTTLLATWLYRRAELKKHHRQEQEKQVKGA